MLIKYLKKDKQYIFNYRSSKESQEICTKMKQYARLDTLFDVMTGSKPYQEGKGIPPQTKEIKESKPYTGFEKIDDTWVPYMRGRSISRYCNRWNSNKEYIKYGVWLAEPRSPEVFAGKKIFIRQTGDSLIAEYDESNVSNNTLHSIYPLASNEDVNLFYLLGLLNSKLLNWYHQTENYLELGKPMAEVKGIYIKKLPIAIGTDEQKKQVEQYVIGLMEACQNKYDEKYKFIHYIESTYEPKTISEKLEDFELLTFKNFVAELKKQKVNLSSSQQIELLSSFEEYVSSINNKDKQIKVKQDLLDTLILDIYEISEDRRGIIDFEIIT